MPITHLGELTGAILGHQPRGRAYLCRMVEHQATALGGAEAETSVEILQRGHILQRHRQEAVAVKFNRASHLQRGQSDCKTDRTHAAMRLAPE